MSKNKTLSAAKSAKNDEFYTQYNDIQKEINAYLDYDPDTFRGKTVLLPCDDPEWSKFTRFFAENFERLGLKKLISTSYAAASKKFFNAETQRRGDAESEEGVLATKNAKSAKQFLIIGSMNAVSYTEVFPHIQGNTIWLGATGFATGKPTKNGVLR